MLPSFHLAKFSCCETHISLSLLEWDELPSDLVSAKTYTECMLSIWSHSRWHGLCHLWPLLYLLSVYEELSTQFAASSQFLAGFPLTGMRWKETDSCPTLPHCMTLRCSEQMEFIKHDGPHAPTMPPHCSHHSTLLVGIKPPRMKFSPLLLPAQLFPESVLFCWIQKKRHTDGKQGQHWLPRGKAPTQEREDCHLSSGSDLWILDDRQKGGSTHLCFGWLNTEWISSHVFLHQLLQLYDWAEFFQILAPG